eukprot:15118397-Alexandrium_andersonii.AAC.1
MLNLVTKRRLVFIIAMIALDPVIHAYLASTPADVFSEKLPEGPLEDLGRSAEHIEVFRAVH